MIGIGNFRAFFATHQIASARNVENEHGTEMADLKLIDGSTVKGVMTWDDFSATPVQLIPAAPDTSLLHAWTDGSDPAGWELGRTPLIGWALCMDGNIRPVTPSGVNDGCGEPQDIGNYVELPSGQVVSTSPWAGRAGFDDAQQFFADALEVRGKVPARKIQV